VSKLVLVALLVAVFAGACSFGDGEEGENTNTVQTTTLETGGEETAPPAQPGLAEDPDDVTSPLDLESASAVRTGDLLAVSVTTYEQWAEGVLSGPRIERPGPNRLTLLYDTNLDQRADYTGRIIFAEGALSVVIAGQGQAFEPVPVERPDDATAQFVHPIDVFFVVLGQEEVESDVDIQIAFESVVEGAKDRAPDRGWLLVAVGP
jgi:hypothetical protein